MMIIARIIVALAMFLTTNASFANGSDIPLTTDSRIKTYIYSPNEVYLLVLHYGFQSHIEFAKGENIDTITLGDTYAWKITPLENRIFIKPMEKNIRTFPTCLAAPAFHTGSALPCPHLL